ncbi:MAG: class I SAM-dependent methyltransferase [Candidatus Jordarchaeaceae archaeon]
MTVKEVIRYYSTISEKYDRLRLGSEKSKFISILQLDWFVKNLKNNSILLEIGCGTGRVTQLLVKKSKFLIAVDASPAMIKINRCRLKNSLVCYVVCDATYLPFRGNTFDNIVGARVFWHIPNFSKALRESSRALKIGGVLLFDFPSSQGPFSLYTRLCHVKNDVLTLFARKSDIEKAFKPIYNISFFYNTTIFVFFTPAKLFKCEMICRLLQLLEKLNYKFFNNYVFSYFLIRVVKKL